ncbi:O-antigen/teichoic acid export membrane protein [Microbacterium endophyticum]|uniref:O-antigen/teichoic acid export membrane protein n=1 Tax=Microbacterium endophyticum TaxID=1526412 RepID=A0A7W4V2C1_9MICO|nr:oligosaccharide flippase family protein [Microbacterium endophyticum]MBB2975531.1 O-antigen/teichoic acid export membrane protein [Microbacterium endophyticum]NIK35450.1 O-antigen/teichoic acid export membrane protein [Microbacterium endophyticum]
MSTGGRLFRGAAWLYGAQLFSIMLQVAYAAITSRIAAPAAFGDYSVALTATGLITVLASGGLAQSVGRMQSLPKSELGSIASFAGCLGLISGLATLLLSAPLSWIWAAPGSAPVIALLSINALTAPMFGFLLGLLRRTGRFRKLAIYTLASNLCGMTIGAVLVGIFQNAEALVASTILSQTMLLAIIWVTVRREFTFSKISWSSEEVAFSGRITIASAIQYASGNVVRLAAARTLGAPMIGQWNRAEVLATLPFQQIQAVMVQVVYPEFRHHRDSTLRAHNVWSDLLAMVAWVTWPLGAIAATTLPFVIPVVFGKGWEPAADFSRLLALAGGIQPVHMMLLAAVEALALFRIVWTVSAVQLVTQVLLVVGLVAWGDPRLAVSSLLFANVVGHVVTIWMASRRGLLNLRALSVQYLMVAVASMFVAALVYTTIYALFLNPTPAGAIAIAIVWLVVFAAAIRFRESLPPVRFARRFGLFGPKA